MIIQARVLTNPAEGTATLEWRELLSERKAVMRASDFEDFDPETDEDWVEEFTIPTYAPGPPLAEVVRPLSEFRQGVGIRGSLTEYVERHLPRPEIPALRTSRGAEVTDELVEETARRMEEGIDPQKLRGKPRTPP